MKLTGHKTREVFRRYNIVDDRDQRLAVQKLAQFFGQTPSTSHSD